MKFSVRNTINLIKKNQQKAVDIAMQDGRTLMVKTIQSGKMRTSPYSEKYKQYRLKKGRSARVDWTFTGTLMRGVFSEAKKSANQIVGRVSIAGANKGSSNLKILQKQIELRPGMWGFSRTIWSKVIKTLKRELKI